MEETPSVRDLGSVFHFTWMTAQLHVTVQRVRQHTAGNTSAELLVESTAPGTGDFILHRNVSDLLGPNVRKDIARDGSEKLPLPEEGDWRHVVDVVFEEVLRRTRDTEPAKLLVTVPITESVDWLLYPFLHMSHSTVLFGFGGTLKSFMAAWLAVRVCLGIDAEPSNVEVLDYESDDQDWRRRVAMICEGMGVAEPQNLFYRYCTQPLADDIEAIQRDVRENEIGLLIVDSAAYACGGEPEKADPTMQFFRAIRTCRVTSLVIAHQPNEEKSKRPFGSVYWVNSPRAVLQVQKADQQGEAIAEVGLFQRKTNYGRGGKSFGYTVEFNQKSELVYTAGDRITFSTKRLVDIADLADEATIYDRVTDYLRSYAKASKATMKELAAELRIKEPTLRTILAREQKRGRLVVIDGEWALAAHQGAPAPVATPAQKDDSPW